MCSSDLFTSHDMVGVFNLKQIQIKHQCESCDSQFSISYDELNTESDPTFCPFCAEYLMLNNEYDGEEEDD